MIRTLSAAVLGAVAISLTGVAVPAFASLTTSDRGPDCIEGHPGEDSSSARGSGGRSLDHRDVSRSEQAAIERRTDRRLARKGNPAAGATVPVYVHVMAAEDGSGDVPDSQIAAQIAALNNQFGGGEAGSSTDTGFAFTLAATDRYYDDSWHLDRASNKYRSSTRQGGAGALNIWLVDFQYLGIATFPWDYAKKGAIDGIRVHFDSLPGGSIPNYNEGDTATHEAGHWLGLFHTFQGGCTETNDGVEDTPAQSSPTTGCPEGRDSCPLPGLDPIHNYMDYSYDSCYTTFSDGQATRMREMWTAYRG